MNNSINIRTIIENNEANRIALSGRIPRLAAYLSKQGVKVQEKVLYRATNEYESEAGINRINWTRLIVFGLHGIGETAAANYLSQSFGVADNRRKRFQLDKFLENMWIKAGEISALGVKNAQSELFRLKRFEMKSLMDAEIV